MQVAKQTGVSSQLHTLFRGTVAGTNLATGAIVSFGLITVQSVENTDMIAMQFLDSPSTTSATTYTAGFRVDGNTGTIQFAGATSVMILMEIGAWPITQKFWQQTTQANNGLFQATITRRLIGTAQVQNLHKPN